jgi:Domain of unknown function (DUF4258)
MALPLIEPLSPNAARGLLRAILASGEVVFSGHALTEMENDGITQADVIRVLRGGMVEPAELERGSWRYRVRAQNVYAVVSFRSESHAIVVTAWSHVR